MGTSLRYGWILTFLLVTILLFPTFYVENIRAAPPGDWWNVNYPYYRQITITNNNASVSVVVNYTVNITVDTQSMVSAGKLQADGDDLRIVYWDGANNWELNRINTSAWNTAATNIWFKINASIAASGTDSNYYMYYGYGAAVNPPINKSRIYEYWEDFESYGVGTDPSGWTEYGDGGTWDVSSTLTYEGSRAYRNTVGGGGESRTYYSGDGATWSNYSVEAWMTRPTDTSSYYNHLTYYVNTADIQDYYMWGWGTTDRANIYRHNGGYLKIAGDWVANHAVNEWHNFRMQIWGQDFHAYYDDALLGSVNNALYSQGHIGFRCDKPAAGAYYYDNIIVRFYMEPEPTLSLGGEVASNTPAVQSNESPVDTSNQIVHNPFLIITVNDTDSNMSIYFYTNASGAWALIGSNLSAANGTYQQQGVNMNVNATQYWWSVNVSDNASAWTNQTYTFTTGYQNISAGGNVTVYADVGIIQSHVSWNMVMIFTGFFTLLPAVMLFIWRRRKRR